MPVLGSNDIGLKTMQDPRIERTKNNKMERTIYIVLILDQISDKNLTFGTPLPFGEIKVSAPPYPYEIARIIVGPKPNSNTKVKLDIVTRKNQKLISLASKCVKIKGVRINKFKALAKPLAQVFTVGE
jgi:hypothetical protein